MNINVRSTSVTYVYSSWVHPSL